MKIKIGVIGSGEHFTRNIYPSIIKHKSFQLEGILSKKKKEYLNIRCYSEVEFFKLDLDIVYISTPSKIHAKYILKSLKKKINVVCEKPLCTNLSQLNKIKKLTQKNKLFLFEGFMYRFHPAFKYIKKIIDTDKFGKIISVKSSFTIPKLNKNNNRYNLKTGGGFFLDLAVYPLSLNHYLFGRKIKSKSFVSKTYKNNKRLSLRGDITIKDNFKMDYKWGVSLDYSNFLEIVFKNGKLNTSRFYSKNKYDKTEIYLNSKKFFKKSFKPLDQFYLMFDYIQRNYRYKSIKQKELENVELHFNNLIRFKNDF